LGEAEHRGCKEHDGGGYLNDERLFGVRRKPGLSETEETPNDRYQEGDKGGKGEANSDDCSPDASHGDHSDSDYEASDGLQQEERADCGNRSVPVGFCPKVEVHVRGPRQEKTADHEAGRRGHRARSGFAAGAPKEQGPSHRTPILHLVDSGGRAVAEVRDRRGHSRHTKGWAFEIVLLSRCCAADRTMQPSA
jgi:hypothetical protein